VVADRVVHMILSEGVTDYEGIEYMPPFGDIFACGRHLSLL